MSRVLYLVPPPRHEGRLTGYSFLDEEIEALAGEGVDAYVFTPAYEEPARAGGATRVGFPRAGRIARRTDGAVFALRHGNRFSRKHLREPRASFFAARVESAAAHWARELSVDLIHSHFGWPEGFGGMLAKEESGVPLVATFHGMDLLCDPALRYGLRRKESYDAGLRRLVRAADRTVYHSAYMRARGVALGAPPERTEFVRRGVDTRRFSPGDRAAVRAALGIDGPLVLTVAGLIRRKGIDVLLRAIAATTRDVTAVVCGEGRDREGFEELARELRVESRLRFLGQVDREDVPRYFQAADVFVLPSRIEAAGIVLMEAMACGTPVVCTASGGPPEYVRDGETGIVVPAGDAMELAAAIDRLLADPDRRARMGRAGREDVLRHDEGDMVRGYLRIYDEVAAQPVGRVT